MARPTTEQRLANVHQRAMAQFDDIQSAVREERLQCLQDRRFYSIAGAQWEGPLAEQYENKPKFEVNKVHLAVIRIINEQRNNRVSVDFVSKDGSEYDSLADTCDDLYRSDEQDSGAQEAYNNAFEEAVAGGFGAWRLRTCYEDEEDDEDERQRIRMEPIYDADSSVFFDLNAKRQDKADARHAYVLTATTRKAYIEDWGDDPASWPKEIHQFEFDWATPDVVYVAEYYEREDVTETVRIFRTLDGSEERYKDAQFEMDDSLEERLAAIGSVEVRQKRVKRKRVHKYILSGNKVLEDCGIIAGRAIPIVPVYGKRWFVDNIERCMGHVRLAKDAQRLKNMQLSKLGEISAYSSVEKPILLPEQVAGHQMMWAEDNLKNYPYLLINPITNMNGETSVSGPIAYTKSPVVPPALAGMIEVTESDMAQILGNQQQAEQIVPNVSGKAIELIQSKIDMQSFIYMSNFAIGIQRSGEIWLSMARDVYVEEGRKMKGVTSQGKMRPITIMQPMLSSSGEIEMENDLSEAEFDVLSTVGPSSVSKRAATVRALTGMMLISDDPETKAVLSAMAMMNMEGEGIDDVREFFRKKLLRMGAVKPTDQEAAELAQAAAGQQPDPQSLYLQAAAQEAQAKAGEAQSRTIRNQADADLLRAKTLETLANTDASEQEQALEVIDRVTANRPAQQMPPAPTVVVAEPPPTPQF